MSENRKIILHDSEFKKRAVEAVWDAPEGWEVLIKPPTRSPDQNAKFHAIIGDMANYGLFWAGKYRSFDEIKVLLVSGHAEATKDRYTPPVEIIEGFEGELVTIRESTASMSKARSSSLIEYAIAFCAMNGIKLWQKFKPKGKSKAREAETV